MSINSRFWVSLVMSVPMVAEMVLHPLTGWMLPGGEWTMLGLTTIVMAVSAGPFMQSAWASFQKHHSNMDTLVAIGTATAYLYSIYAMITHQAVFFESAAVVTTFVLLGQVFEERMRNNASNAVRIGSASVMTRSSRSLCRSRSTATTRSVVSVTEQTTPATVPASSRPGE